MARIGSLVLLVLLGLAIAENPQPVAVVVLGRTLPPWPLGVWMTIAFGIGAGLGAIARWLWPPSSPSPESVARPKAEPQPKTPEPPRVEEDDEEWWEDLEPELRDRPPNGAVEPPIAEEDEDEDDEDTYLIARYIRR
ncbi:MAG TPA: hypothetical protein DCQ32_02020 [Cyanobacteria bacterium UBA8156]|jgi:hypothetical protein|nr:hypothetical protein [Cyanobacteria bacterium UBA8156]